MQRFLIIALYCCLLCLSLPAYAAVIVEGKVPDSAPAGAYRVQDFAGAVEQGKVAVIDVRTPGAFAKRHLTESENKPYGDRNNWIAQLDPAVSYIFICDEGELSKRVVDEIKATRPEMKDTVFYLDAEIAFQKNGDIYVKAN